MTMKMADTDECPVSSWGSQVSFLLSPLCECHLTPCDMKGQDPRPFGFDLLALACVCVCVRVRACFLLSGEGYGGGWACFSLAQPPFRETGRKSLSGTEEPTRLMASGPVGVLKGEAQAARRAVSCRGPRSQALAGVSGRRLFLL